MDGRKVPRIKSALQSRSQRTLTQERGSLVSTDPSQRILSSKMVSAPATEFTHKSTSRWYTSQTQLPSSAALSTNTHKLRREETLTKKKLAWERIDTIKQDMYRQHQMKRIDQLFYGKPSSQHAEFRVRRKSPVSLRPSQAVRPAMSLLVDHRHVGRKVIGDFDYLVIRQHELQQTSPHKSRDKSSKVLVPNTLVVQRPVAIQVQPQTSVADRVDLSKLRKKFGDFVKDSFVRQDAPHLVAVGPEHRY